MPKGKSNSQSRASRDSVPKEKKEYTQDEEERSKKLRQTAFWIMMVAFFMLLAFLKYREESFRAYNISKGKTIEEDLYATLGVHYTAPINEIKSAYKNLAAELHPDKNPDCEDCKEKFEAVAKAYEIQGDEEKRKFYDTTSGSQTVIRSSTINLTSENFKNLVEDSNDIWIIMIYVDDSTCATFTNFWDEVSKQYPYIKFGRVNNANQGNLLPRLPFRAEEFPFVFSSIKGKVSEFLDFNMEKPSPYELRKFVGSLIDVHYTELEYNGFVSKLKAEQTTKPEIYNIVRRRVPSSFSYLAYKTNKWIDFYSTKLSDNSKVIKHLGVNEAAYVLKFPEHLSYADKPWITLDFEANEKAHMNLLSLARFVTIPEIRRYGFMDYCGFYAQDHKADISGDFPTVCVIALKQKHADYYMSISEYFRNKQEELVQKYVVAARKQEENVFSRLKAIQFAVVNLDDNILFKELIEKTGISKPKAMIYLSVEDQYQVLNNIDDLQDVVDDIIDGSATSLKNLRDLTEGDTPLSAYLTPDDMTFFNLVLKHVMTFFDGFKYVMAYGLLFFAVEKYANIPYLHIAIGLKQSILAYSVLMAYQEGKKNGVF